jgi:hypothetical protein
MSDFPMTKAERRRQRRELRRRNALVPVVPAPIVIAQPARELASAPTPRPVPVLARCIIGVPLIGAALALVYASARANAWAGFALSVDNEAGRIFATLTVTAELIAFLMPTANRLYRQMGERWSVAKGSLILIVACAIVAFAASGFILTNVSDKTAQRAGASPAVEVAERALDDARAARDRECKLVGTICRRREDAVVARQLELTDAMARAAATADPQAFALGIDPTRLRMAQAGVLVMMCLLAGFVLSHGWGLVFRG